jgi:uroporphyrinogen-III synthase
VIFLSNDVKFDGVENLPLLSVEYLNPSIDLSGINSLILTSKNAVHALDATGKAWKEKHIFAVGDATADLVRASGGKVYHTAKGYGEELAKDIIRKFPFGNYLYCRGKEVAADIVGLLRRSNISISEIVVYRTRCNPDVRADIPKKSIIIFTSPKTVRCFFDRWEWDGSWRAVVIGQTTKKALPKGLEVLMPKTPSLKEAVALARGLEN